MISTFGFAGAARLVVGSHNDRTIHVQRIALQRMRFIPLFCTSPERERWVHSDQKEPVARASGWRIYRVGSNAVFVTVGTTFCSFNHSAAGSTHV